MPAGLKVGLVAGLAVAVGFVLWAVNQSGDATKNDLPFDSPVQAKSKTQLAQDVAKSFTNDSPTRPTPIAKIPPRTTPNKTGERKRSANPAGKKIEPSRTRPLLPGTLNPKPAARNSDGPVSAPKRRDTAGQKTPSTGAGGNPASTDPKMPKTIGTRQPGDQPLEPRVSGATPGPRTNADQPVPKPRTQANDVPKAPEPKRTVPRPVVTPGQTVHTVVAGDTLIFIAGQNYFDENLWRAIKLANPDVDANKLKIGQKIAVPTEAEAKRMLARAGSGGSTPKTPAIETPARSRKPTGSGSTGGSQSPGSLIYVVESGDSLIKIARKALGDDNRWREIFELNQDQLASADQIQVGMKLKMPKK